MVQTLKNKGYNPFVKRSQAVFDGLTADEIERNGIPKQIISDAVGTLNLTAAQIAATYELLDFQRLRPVLDNIIHLGLRDSMMCVLKKHGYEQIADELAQEPD